MKFLSLFVLFYNFAAVEGRLFGRDCSQYDNKKDCIKYYQCSWCNNTIDNDGNSRSEGLIKCLDFTKKISKALKHN